MQITVPPVPQDLHPASCWRRTLTDLNPQAVGGYRAIGTDLNPGDTVDVPEGTLILAVDKATRGWERHYVTGDLYAVKDATVTVYLAAKDTLTEVWSRQYMTAKAAFGAATTNKLTTLLAKHPAPVGTPVVLHEVRRPNHKEGRCRWCNTRLSPGLGHLVGHGKDAQVEHYQDCPAGPCATTGEPCALCGVPVVRYQASKYVVRDGSGRIEVRHHKVDGKTCLEQPVRSPEEQAAALAERDRAERERAAAERAQQEKKEAARAKRKAAREAKRKAAHDAEQARVAALKVVGRDSRTLYDKSLGGHERARLEEHTLTLSDGTTTLRWSVGTYASGPAGAGFTGEDYDPYEGATTEFTVLADARDEYRRLQYQQPAPGRSADWDTGGTGCAECSSRRGVVKRRDSSGIEGRVCHRCDRENPDDVMLSFA